MRIVSVGKSRTALVLLSVLLEEGAAPRTLGITEAEYRALGAPAVGEELSEECAEQLLSLDEYHRANTAAVRILSFGDNTPTVLVRKLRQRGFSAEAAERAAAAMVERGYIREADQLERAVRLCAAKLWGPRRIADALAGKGFAREEVFLCIERLRMAGELDFSAARRRLLEKQGKGTAPQKLRALLYRYGYGGTEE